MQDLGMLLMSIVKNPSLAAQLDSLGIPPPSAEMMKLGGPGAGAGNADLGSMMPQSGTSAMPDLSGGAAGGIVSEPTTNPWEATVTPTSAGPEGSDAAGGKNKSPSQSLALAAMQGFKAPAPPQQPTTMGVTGGVKAPEMQKVSGSSPVLAALLAAAMGASHGTPAAPDLGALMRGGRGY